MDVTFIIATLLRPEALRGCLRSIRRRYAWPILVADDSPEPYAPEMCKSYDRDCTAIAMPHDSGLSAKRNALLERVQTSRFVLMDDDHELHDDSAVSLLGYLDRGYDIAGGYYREGRRRRDWQGELWVEDGGHTLRFEPVDPAGRKIVGADVVQNFFAANTDAVRRMGGWRDDLKLIEHLPFFWDAKRAGLRVGYAPDCSVYHHPTHAGEYRAYRYDRQERWRGQQLEAMGVRRLVSKHYRIDKAR